MKNAFTVSLGFLVLILVIVIVFVANRFAAPSIVFGLHHRWPYQNGLNILDLKVPPKALARGLLSREKDVLFEISGTLVASNLSRPKITSIHVTANWVSKTGDCVAKAEIILTPVVDVDFESWTTSLGINPGEEYDEVTTTEDYSKISTTEPFSVKAHLKIPTWDFGKNCYTVRSGNLVKEFVIHQQK